MTEPAWIDLEGVANMRDVGGLPTTDGGTVQPGRLLRSDNLQDLTAADIDRLLQQYGVTDVVDLRSNTELRITGPAPMQALNDVAHYHFSLFPDDRPADTADALVLPWHGRAEQPRDVDPTASHYLGYLAERPDSISAALAVLARSAGATVVHCAAGKDRTGTVVALALTVAGVPRDAVVADYAASTERVERIVERLRVLPGYAENLAGVPMQAHYSRPEVIDRLLDAVAEEAGSVPDWLRSQGWSDEQVTALRDKLVTP
ncbi:tyrosine-protein phosphatase [Rudaeicoccus suwonensis]|uniref:Protein tyrosine/serine phosphatase n=1 Tax=Rudaeicoccus suwonensis TaxID=657409 RepID=A0A561ECN2_9MICO|nr:tyrosine-protein phosphatase [Rudaeicoccus suwonensis]TWE13378.1 protein tyrosine/serine phosphatase [Rudaeicoccus suwonensis]